MQLTCPKCGTLIPGADLDTVRGVGVCRPCAEIVPFPEVAAGPFKPYAPLAVAAESAAMVPAPSAMLYRPEHFRFIERTDVAGYEATVRPNRLHAVPIAFFALFWNCFVVFWMTMAFKGAGPFALFGLIHFGAGLFMAHRALTSLFNTRRVALMDGRMRFDDGPVPSFANFERDLDSIDGFTVSQRESRGRGNTTVQYRVNANFSNGTSKVFDIGAPDLPSAEFAVMRLNEELHTAKTRRLPYRG
jgi:hypothetical protein